MGFPAGFLACFAFFGSFLLLGGFLCLGFSLFACFFSLACGLLGSLGLSRFSLGFFAFGLFLSFLACFCCLFLFPGGFGSLLFGELLGLLAGLLGACGFLGFACGFLCRCLLGGSACSLFLANPTGFGFSFGFLALGLGSSALFGLTAGGLPGDHGIKLALQSRGACFLVGHNLLEFRTLRLQFCYKRFSLSLAFYQT